jgi:hypothetical protein
MAKFLLAKQPLNSYSVNNFFIFLFSGNLHPETILGYELCYFYGCIDSLFQLAAENGGRDEWKKRNPVRTYQYQNGG